MRQIHPVSFHEKFVASGVYLKSHEGMPANEVEQWTIHEQPDGAQLIRVDSRLSNHSNALIEGWRSPSTNGGRIERLDIYLWGEEKNGIRSKATYLFEAESVQIGYVIGDQSRQPREMDLPARYIVTIRPSYLFWGFMVADVVNEDGKCVPLCELFFPTTVFHEPRFSEVSMMIRESSGLVIAGKTVNARVCQWHHHCDAPDRPIDPDVGPFFWIDEYDILILTDDSKMSGDRTALTQYARRPDPPKS